MSHDHESLVALRKGAPRGTKLSVSRPARLKKQRSARLRTPETSARQYVTSLIANHKHDGRMTILENPDTFLYAIRKSERFYDFTARYPTIKELGL